MVVVIMMMMLKSTGINSCFCFVLFFKKKIKVVLHSDGSVVHKGFSATWKSVEAAAMPTSGEIMSPNYPDKYPDNLNRKEYKIVVATGKKVELTSSAQGQKSSSRWSCPSWTWRSRRTGQRAPTTTSRPTTHLLGDLQP